MQELTAPGRSAAFPPERVKGPRSTYPQGMFRYHSGRHGYGATRSAAHTRWSAPPLPLRVRPDSFACAWRQAIPRSRRPAPKFLTAAQQRHRRSFCGAAGAPVKREKRLSLQKQLASLRAAPEWPHSRQTAPPQPQRKRRR